jgi:putative redox protein
MPTIHAIVSQQDHSASRAVVRGHELLIDRPAAKGGQDRGPMGGEALLMGLGGCFMSNLLAAAIARDVTLHDARAEIEGDLVDAPARYSAIRMRVSADCEPPGELAKLVTIAERGCIVANTLRSAVALSVECRA